MTDQSTTYGPTGWTPDHYRGDGLQPFDVINAFGLDFYEGNAIKYLLRWRKKNGIDDLCKARTYVQVLIDRAQREADGAVLQSAVEEKPEPMSPLHILAVETDSEEGRRDARRTALQLLLARLERGAMLAEERALLREHVEAEIREADTARSVAAGNKRHVQVMYAELESAHESARRALEQRQEMAEERHALQRRAEQAEDLLLVAHETSNRSETERARAVQRTEQALAAIERVRVLATKARDRNASGSTDHKIGKYDVAVAVLTALDGTEQPTAEEG